MFCYRWCCWGWHGSCATLLGALKKENKSHTHTHWTDGRTRKAVNKPGPVHHADSTKSNQIKSNHCTRESSLAVARRAGVAEGGELEVTLGQVLQERPVVPRVLLWVLACGFVVMCVSGGFECWAGVVSLSNHPSSAQSLITALQHTYPFTSMSIQHTYTYNIHIQHTDLGEVLEPRLPGQRLVQLPQARRLPLGDFQFSLVDGGVVIWWGVCVASVYVPSTYLSQPRGRAHTYTHLEGLGQVGRVELAGPDLRPVNVLLPALAENAKTKGRRGIYTYFCGGFECACCLFVCRTMEPVN